MDKQSRNQSASLVVLIVGLAFSAAVWIGLGQIATSIQYVANAQSQVASVPQQQVLAPPSTLVLPDNRFAIINTYSVQVFEVDASGHIWLADWINTTQLESITP